MTTYRTGAHWGRTIVRVGTLPADGQGRRPDDELVGVVDSPALADRICDLLNEAGDDDGDWPPGIVTIDTGGLL